MANEPGKSTGTVSIPTNPPTVSQVDLVTASQWISMLEIIEQLLEHSHTHDDIYYSNCECQCGGGGGTT